MLYQVCYCDQYDEATASSRSVMEETTTMKKQILRTTTETLASLSPCDSLLSSLLSILSFDLFEEILCRLPLRSLMQFKCVCKSWKLLISNPKFAKKHLRISLTFCRDSRHHLIANPSAKHEYCLVNH